MSMDCLLQFHLIERHTPYEISEQLAFRGGHMRGEPGQEPTAVLSLQVDNDPQPTGTRPHILPSRP